jgi:cytochrome c peroxidase
MPAQGQPQDQSPDLELLWHKRFVRPTAPLPAPADNPPTPERIALGARLFGDSRLSGSAKRACTSCHQPERSFTEARPRALSPSGTPLRRNTSALHDLAWGKLFFWDGRAASLEAQVEMPIGAADEMGGDWPTILSRLGEDAGFTRDFQAAFPDSPAPTRSGVVKALASYVRSLVSPRNRFDAWVDGDAQALRPEEVRGFRLFVGKAACVLCHVGWRFTDDRFHDIGLPSKDGGRGAVAGGTPGLMAFKTPSLRELVRTAPYMHDGSLATLEDVLRHYTGSLIKRPSLAININRELLLSPQERADLIAFLRALSSEQGPARNGRAGPR